jgi:transposase
LQLVFSGGADRLQKVIRLSIIGVEKTPKRRNRMTINRLLKTLLNVKGATVDGAEFAGSDRGEVSLTVHVHVHKKDRWRCPVCGRKCHVHDYVGGESFWRGMDFGPVMVRLGARVPRVCCGEHGILTAAVPWAKHGSRFTLDFACSATWMVKSGLSRKRVSERMRIDWETVGRLVDLVRKDLERDVSKRLDGLVRIGIDETSYRKGHSYMTTVVNHDTNTVIWACKGHGKENLDKFFAMLTPEQRASIVVVTGDGARWITDCVEEHCPNAIRCLDPFHVVEWANDALDAVRIDAWRRALDEWKSIGKDTGGAGAKDAAKAAKKRAEQIKHSKYALGKNPENLTDRQRERLSVIQAEDGPLNRAHVLKEQLRLILHMDDAEAATACLDRWTSHAQRCRIPSFVELQRKIRRHRDHILNAIRHGASNARIEALNNKIKLLIRIAYGFRNIDTMIGLVMLFCSNIQIPWPSSNTQMSINKGVTAQEAA